MLPLGQARAAMAFLGSTYNVRVRDIVGRGQIKHSDFAMASGELSRRSFVSCRKVWRQLSACRATAHVHFVCMDCGATARVGGIAYHEMMKSGGLGKDQRRTGRVLPQRASSSSGCSVWGSSSGAAGRSHTFAGSDQMRPGTALEEFEGGVGHPSSPANSLQTPPSTR